MSTLARADVVVIGPAPPLRGGIAQHTARLVEALELRGVVARAVSWRRLYPALLFPGRDQRAAGEIRPAWSDERLDVLDPRTWLRLARELDGSRALVVLQWWTPVVAPALAASIARLDGERLVAICHNVLPHEPVPGARVLARAVLGRCRRVVFHSRFEQGRAHAVLAGPPRETACVPLPCLLPASVLGTSRDAPGVPPSARLIVAAGHVRPYKGTMTLLAAWQQARRPAGALLVVVGESYLSGPERRQVADAVSMDRTVLFIDRYVTDEELVSFLNRAEALVLPYLSASQSGMLAIARAIGLPCIATSAGGLAEQAAADGEINEIVASGDVRSLAEALERRLAQPRGQRAVITEETFRESWQRVVEAIGIEKRP